MLTPLTPAQRTELETAVARYQSSVDTVAGYLAGRGITQEVAEAFRLGCVTDPVPGDEGVRGRLAIPFLTPAGPVQIRFRSLDPNAEAKYLPRPGNSPTLFNVGALRTSSDVLVLCYSPDTEVLTPGGWVRLDRLARGVPVAQWGLDDGAVSFVQPTAYHRYHFQGDMAHLSATFADLLVTPDHRQPARHARRDFGARAATLTEPTVKRADRIGANTLIPVAGHLAGSGGPGEDVARLLVAWLADGCSSPRDPKVWFNLKKRRKKDRLRKMLADAGIPWTEHVQPSSKAWTNFRIRRTDFASVLDLASEGKRWRWEWLSWAETVRLVMLDEIGHWDGDFGGAVNGSRAHGTVEPDSPVRLFTAEAQDADVVSAMCATTGLGAVVRKDNRASRPDQRTQYVVNINRRPFGGDDGQRGRWRQMSRRPARVPYDGDVFCLTVPSSFLVVRRNGKVVVSGNCEGELDAITMHALVGVPAVGVPGVTAWEPFWARLFVDFERVVIPTDGDDAGRGFGKSLAKQMGNVTVIELPSGQDVNSLYLAEGADALRARLGI